MGLVSLTEGRTEFTCYDNMKRIPEGTAPDFKNKSAAVSAWAQVGSSSSTNGEGRVDRTLAAGRRHHPSPSVAQTLSIIACVPRLNSNGQGYSAPSRMERPKFSTCNT